MFKKKSTLLLSLLLVMTLLLTACGGEETSGLTVAQGADPKSLDPHATNDQPSSRVNAQIYDRLVEADEDMNIIPGLAEEWEQDSEDERVWTFKIREGVKFHNGEELKPEDVKFTLDRMMASGEVGHIVGAIETVEVIEGNQVKITTTEPFSPLLAHLTHTAASILSEKEVTEKGEDYHAEPIGTGPFKFVELVPAEHVKLERFDDYWGEKSKEEIVVFKPITEGAQRTIGLETGEVDIAYDVEPVDLELVKGNDELELVQEPSLSTAYVGFNMQKEPFTDPLVRQAINYAVNVQDVIDSALEGAGEIANGPINDKVFGFDSDLEAYEYNPEKAKELLAQGGYKDGDINISVALNDSPVRIKIAESIQGQLKEVGINLNIDMMEWAAFLDKTGNGEHDMFILGWVAVTGDADYGLYPLFHTSQHGSAGNRTFYSNKEVDELLEKGRKSSDEAERLESYKKAQEIIVEDAPEIFLYFDNQNVGLRKGVEGFRLHPAGHHRLVNVSKAK